jgi:hypothetical protein
MPASAGIDDRPFSLDPGDGVAARVTDPFGNVTALEVADSVEYSVGGRIYVPGEVDVYDIGAVVVGDHLEIEVMALSSGLDPSVAVFDAEQDSMIVNDDRHYYHRDLDARLDFSCHRSSLRCYIAVSSSARSDTTGEYELRVKRSPGVPAGEPHPQIVYLDFEGAEQVVIGGRPAVDVPPFSGDMIGPAFADDTDELIEKLVARVRHDYAGYNVVILSSREGERPAEHHSTAYFGSYDPLLLGVAETVDAFNEDPAQQAVIFADTFAAFAALNPTVEEMADALANVTSHEVGHLLGLNHVTDPHGIMDVTATLRQMLTAQAFVRAPLGDDTFAVGYQNSPELLLESVGGDPVVLEAARVLRKLRGRDPWYDEGPATPARQGLLFGTGCLSSRSVPMAMENVGCEPGEHF